MNFSLKHAFIAVSVLNVVACLLLICVGVLFANNTFSVTVDIKKVINLFYSFLY